MAALILAAVGGAVAPERALAEAKEPLLPEGVPVVVLAFSRAGAVEEGVDAILTDLVLEALLNRHGVRALGPSDILGMLNAEQQQQLMGCEDQVCRTELAGAVGAGRLVVGSVGRLGALTVVTVTLIDGVRAAVLSRASERFEKIEEAADAIGPMVDRLLGAAPSVVARPPTPASTTPAAAAEPVKVMEAREYCRVFERWRTRVAEGPYDAAFVETRQELLLDLLQTPFARDYNQKRSCIWERSGWMDNELRRRVLRSDSAEAAQDARRRFFEWRELADQTERVQELWDLGTQREAQGIARPATLPFSVAEVSVPEAEESEELTRFRADYPAAAAVVARAVEAVARGDQPGFESLFGPEVQGRSRTSPHYVYSSLRGMHEGGSALAACPIWLLDYRTMERSAKSYAENGLLQGCLRVTKEDFARTDDVRLRRDGERWVIDRW